MDITSIRRAEKPTETDWWREQILLSQVPLDVGAKIVGRAYHPMRKADIPSSYCRGKAEGWEHTTANASYSALVLRFTSIISEERKWILERRTQETVP